MPQLRRIAKETRLLDNSNHEETLADARRIANRAEALSRLAITPEATEALRQRPLVKALLRIAEAMGVMQ